MMKLRFSSYWILIAIPIFVSCSNLSPKNSVYLIPEGYKGDVIIIFNQPDGVIPEDENGLIVFRIPSDGILKVKTAGESGILEKYYFYLDENGNRHQLEKLRITGERDPSGKPKDKFDGQVTRDEYENKIFVTNTGGLGSFQFKGGSVQFTNFTVGTPKESEELYRNMQVRISRLQLQLNYE